MVEKINSLEQDIFKKFIQTNIEIYTLDSFKNKTVLKSGKLINFNIKLPFLYFLIESKTKSKEFILPQPFKCRFSLENETLLSFKLEDSVDCKKIVDQMKKMGKMSESKIYNKLIYIKTL